jgi:hypothetical protein
MTLRSTNRHIRRLPLLAAALLVVLACAALAAVAATAKASGDVVNEPGNILIADQFNNRIIELNHGHIVWHFGTGSFVAGPHTIVAPNDVQRVGALTLITGTGAPANTPGYPAGGAQDNRVILVDQAGKIVWQYGKAGVAGSGPDLLNAPVQATWLPNGHVLITDQGNARVIEVTKAKKIVWQYGMTGKTGTGPDQLNNPNSAELLANGHVLISDESNNRVLEVTKAKKIVWKYSTGLNAPAFASRLSNGDTLISDSGNARVVEVNRAKKIVWEFFTNKRAGSVKDPAPTRAVRLRNGDTLISDQFNDQVILVNHAKRIVWRYGKIGVSGKTAGRLNAPYDAKVVGDYTGLTPPLAASPARVMRTAPSSSRESRRELHSPRQMTTKFHPQGDAVASLRR